MCVMTFITPCILFPSKLSTLWQALHLQMSMDRLIRNIFEAQVGQQLLEYSIILPRLVIESRKHKEYALLLHANMPFQ